MDAHADLLAETSSQARRYFLTLTMAEFLEYVGCRNIRARIRGWTAPEVVEGRMLNFRPDITCQTQDRKLTWAFVAVVMASDLLNNYLPHRLYLFSDEAQRIGGELHVVVEHVKLRSGLTLRQTVQARAPLWGVRINAIHEI